LLTGLKSANPIATAGPHIISPRSDQLYHLRLEAGTGANLLNLEASSGTASDRIYWFIDSTYLGSSGSSKALSWAPAPGRHTIHAIDELGKSDSRSVTVVAVE
jgi:membrane carboxypeptidase/penicillin-binding protein PbpC